MGLCRRSALTPNALSHTDCHCGGAQFWAHCCPVCWADEARVRFHFNTMLDRSMDDELAELPDSETCGRCGRTYALRHTVIRWLGDDEEAPY